MIKVCLECNKEFKTYYKNQKFCSKSCATTHRNKAKAHSPVKIKCNYCGIIFSVEYKKRDRKYCSKNCFNEWQKDLEMSAESRKVRSKSHIGNIPWSKGKTFEELYGDKAQEMRIKCKSNKKPSPDVKLICNYCKNEYEISYKKRNDSKYCCHKCAMDAMKGTKRKPFSKETRMKMSKAKKGKVRIQSAEEIKNRRLKAIKTVEERLTLGQQLVPNWNPKACNHFEQFDKDNNTNGQHARNGGEYHIKELGYWVDYINHDMKLIMEYDEKKHFDISGNLCEKDIVR